MESLNLTKAFIVGGILSVAGIILFLLIYRLLSDMNPAARLFTSFIIPPVLLGIMLAAYRFMRGNMPETPS